MERKDSKMSKSELHSCDWLKNKISEEDFNKIASYYSKKFVKAHVRWFDHKSGEGMVRLDEGPLKDFSVFVHGSAFGGDQNFGQDTDFEATINLPVLVKLFLDWNYLQVDKMTIDKADKEIAKNPSKKSLSSSLKFKNKLRKLLDEGYPIKQALAITYKHFQKNPISPALGKKITEADFKKIKAYYLNKKIPAHITKVDSSGWDIKIDAGPLKGKSVWLASESHLMAMSARPEKNQKVKIKLLVDWHNLIVEDIYFIGVIKKNPAKKFPVNNSPVKKCIFISPDEMRAFLNKHLKDRWHWNKNKIVIHVGQGTWPVARSVEKFLFEAGFPGSGSEMDDIGNIYVSAFVPKSIMEQHSAEQSLVKNPKKSSIIQKNYNKMINTIKSNYPQIKYSEYFIDSPKEKTIVSFIFHKEARENQKTVEQKLIKFNELMKKHLQKFLKTANIKDSKFIVDNTYLTITIVNQSLQEAFVRAYPNGYSLRSIKKY